MWANVAVRTVGGEAGAGRELGHVDDLDGELLPGRLVDASPDDAERPPANKHRTFCQKPIPRP